MSKVRNTDLTKIQLVEEMQKLSQKWHTHYANSNKVEWNYGFDSGMFQAADQLDELIAKVRIHGK